MHCLQYLNSEGNIFSESFNFLPNLHSLIKNSRYAMTADNNITYITYITNILKDSIFEIYHKYPHYLHSEGSSVKDFATSLNV